MVMGHLRQSIFRLGISAMLAHHLKKGSDKDSPDEQLRGASAVANASRVVKVLSRMTPAMAKNLDLKDEPRSRYFYCADGKQNYVLSLLLATFRRIMNIPGTGTFAAQQFGTSRILHGVLAPFPDWITFFRKCCCPLKLVLRVI